jgi:hypothetical protein
VLPVFACPIRARDRATIPSCREATWSPDSISLGCSRSCAPSACSSAVATGRPELLPIPGRTATGEQGRRRLAFRPTPPAGAFRSPTRSRRECGCANTDSLRIDAPRVSGARRSLTTRRRGRRGRRTVTASERRERTRSAHTPTEAAYARSPGKRSERRTRPVYRPGRSHASNGALRSVSAKPGSSVAPWYGNVRWLASAFTSRTRRRWRL